MKSKAVSFLGVGTAGRKRTTTVPFICFWMDLRLQTRALNLGTTLTAPKITQPKLSIYISVKDLDSSTLCVDRLPSRCGTRDRENSFLQRTILALAQSIIRILMFDSVSVFVSSASPLSRK